MTELKLTDRCKVAARMYVYSDKPYLAGVGDRQLFRLVRSSAEWGGEQKESKNNFSFAESACCDSACRKILLLITSYVLLSLGGIILLQNADSVEV